MEEEQKVGFEFAIFVRLFRLWAMAREGHEPALPVMYKEAARHGFQDQAASACSSLFELVEGHLGRKLQRECCCSARLSADERALIGVLRAAPLLVNGEHSQYNAQGLSRAISWAASSARDAMGITVNQSVAPPASSVAIFADSHIKTLAKEVRADGI